MFEGKGIAQPHGSAVSPDGRTVYVSSRNLRGEYVSTSAGQVGTVVAIDVATQTIAAVIDVGKGTSGVGARTGR